MEKFKKVMMILIVVVLLVGIATLAFGYYKKATLNISNPIATIEVENFGTIKIELYPDKAPETVKNFIKLANNGFYNGTKFHRIIEDFMIQGGDSNGDGTGDAELKDLYGNDDETEYCIKGEFVANGFTQNDINLTEGVIAMARADYTSYSSSLTEESYNSAGTQFFIMTTDDYTNISGYYAGFGKVIEGMDVVKNIAAVEVSSGDDEDDSSDSSSSEESTPVEDVVISSISVETYGVDYGYPETLEPFNYMKWLYSLYGLTYSE